MNRILCYLEYMTPGLAAGALAWLLFRLRRGRTGGGPRSWAMLLFWMYSVGMAVITLAPEPWWVKFALGGRREPYFDLSGLAYRVSLVPFSQPDSLFNIIGSPRSNRTEDQLLRHTAAGKRCDLILNFLPAH